MSDLKQASIKLNSTPIQAKTRKIPSTFTIEPQEDIKAIYGTSLEEHYHFVEWCAAHGFKPDESNPELWKKFKIDTLLKPEDGGFQFRFDNVGDYIKDDMMTSLQYELTAEMDKEVLKRMTDISKGKKSIK